MHLKLLYSYRDPEHGGKYFRWEMKKTLAFSQKCAFSYKALPLAFPETICALRSICQHQHQ